MSIYNFPNQRISKSKKDIEWHKKHILSYITYSGTDSYLAKKEEIRELYYAYSATPTEKQKKIIKATITERYGDNLGPEYNIYPLIENSIQELIGKYRKRPLKRRLLVNNKDAIIKKLDTKIDMISESILRDVNKEISAEIGIEPETEKPQMEIPKDIEEFFSKDYRTLSEEIGENVLYQLLLVKKEKEKIFDALLHFLISGRVFGLLDEKDGHPSIFIPHVLDCYYDIDSNSRVQKDLNLFVFDKYMPINDIYNTFTISDTDEIKLEEYTNTLSNQTWMSGSKDNFRIRVVSMMWKSQKKIRVKVITNKKTKKEEYKILPEGYKKRNKDVIKTIFIDDVRHITMIGPDIVLSFGSVEDQMKSLGDKKKRFLPVVGLVDETTVGNSEIRSVAKKIRYLQDFASEILYEIRLNMRQIDGNAMVYDLANIPKEWAKFGAESALKKVNFYLKRDRMQIINSRDKRANPYASSVNVSQRGRVQEMIGLLSLIEDLAGRITGVKQHQNQYAKATVAEIQYEQVSDRIEVYFGIFDTFVETLLERMIIKSKFIYEENEVFTYFGGDNKMKFLKILPDYLLDDLGVYIGDNRKEYKKKQIIDNAAQQTFANSQTPEQMLDLIRILNTDNSSEAEGILVRGIKALEKSREEMMKAQQEQAKLDSEQKAKDAQNEADLKREGYQKDIEVAKIYANNKLKDTQEKEASSNKRKMADIEQKYREMMAKTNQNNK